MKQAIENDKLINPLLVGKIIEGKMIGRARSTVYLDLGPYGTGTIYGKEFQEAKDDLKKLNPGDKILTKVIDLENEDGYIELSLNQASNELGWDELRQKKEKGELMKVKITGANKGGLLADVLGITAFLPVSQLAPEHYPRVEGADSSKILSELQKFINTELEVKIFDINKRERKLILSEKAKESEKVKEILKSYKTGDVAEVEITGITDFGVFVKFGKENLEGLIHISELDWQLIEDPSSIVKIGEKMEAKIISIADDKVSLSLKALKKDPWENVEEKYKKGDVIEGKVTKLNPFGAFVQIAPKIQGLCHISEFGTQMKMESSLKVDATYKFEILSLDSKDHRMSLKLITTDNKPHQEQEEK